MEYIERYLHQVGKFLPRKGREDILAEIKSHLEDTLDERTNGKPTDEDVIALLTEMGAPQKTAASYTSGGQYLIGPNLYPLFRMIIGIVIAAVLGAQLLAWGIVYWTGSENVDILDALAGLLNSVPVAVGWVVIVFMILQARGVNPKLDDEPWDPRKLPAVEESAEVKRGEVIFGIAGGSVLLAVLAIMPDKIGVYSFPGGEFFANPVIGQYLPWIYVSLMIGIALNVYLLWRGQRNMFSRGAELGSDLLSIGVLAMLYQGHTTWLAAHGSTGFFTSIEQLTTSLDNGLQLMGMEAFRMVFGVALVVVVVTTLIDLIKMIVKSLKGKQAPLYSAK